MAVFLLPSNFIVTGDPRASPSPLWLTHAWRTYTRLQASEERERERERERAPASKSAADFLSNYLRYGVFWRRFSTEHFLSDLFPLIFRHVGSISIRILGFCFTEFFFPKFSEEVCGFVRGWIICHSYGSASILACFFRRALIAMFFTFHVNSIVSQTCLSWDAFISSSRRSDLVTHSCS
jgi:hypothetical protein